ncbi:hypothetical protein AB0B45_00090 [Nonomuraea sp. NPDC049152]|uniref:hypothetical protein n=1 Tax=Nonomuraea sp. NPDC049152 TaxID=3154350 RepID=UPI0033DC7234
MNPLQVPVLTAVRRAIATALTKVHGWSDGFAVTVRAGGVLPSFGGRGQGRAAVLVAHLPTMWVPSPSWPSGFTENLGTTMNQEALFSDCSG